MDLLKLRLLPLICAAAAGLCSAVALADDTTIEKTITALIVDDPMLRRSRLIKVNVTGGVVYLNGTVESLFDKMQAGLHAEKVSGVKEIHNCLKVDFRWPWEDPACGNTCADVFEQEEWF